MIISTFAVAIADDIVDDLIDNIADDVVGENVVDFVRTVAMPDTITVGDVVTLVAEFEVGANRTIIPPETENGFGEFVVLSQDEKRDATSDGVVITATYTYNITTFRPQSCTIPSVYFLIGDESHIDTVRTVPVPITVVSVLPEDAPSCQLNIQDLKAQQKTGGPDLRFLWAIPIIALIVAAVLLIKKYAKKKLADEITIVIKPPYEEALDSIEKLLDKRYVEKGLVREYAFELSEIFKRYLGRRYETNAVELTTEEIVEWFKKSEVTVDMRMCGEKFLRTTDMVKFAKWQPDRQTVEKFLLDVKTFLDETKPSEQSSSDASSKNQTENKTETQTDSPAEQK